MSTCPACGLNTESWASVCPHCHTNIGKIREKNDRISNSIGLFALIIFVIFLLFFSPFLLFNWVIYDQSLSEITFSDIIKNIWAWIGSGAFWVLIGFFFYRSRKKKEPV